MGEFISAPEQTFVERVSEERASVGIIRSSGAQEAVHIPVNTTAPQFNGSRVTLNRF
jgi:hypothetical protein